MIQTSDILKNIISRRVLFHSTFWVMLLLVVFAFENYGYAENFNVSFFFQYVFAFVVFIVVSYFNIWYLIPRVFRKKKYAHYAGALILSVITGTLIIILFREAMFALGYKGTEAGEHSDNNTSYFVHLIFGQGMLLISTTLFYVMEEWIRLQGITIKMQETEGQKIQSELQALKAQINPHFLFNTLNNIYSHSLENSAKTPEMIIKLSELMSYILYECSDEKVPVANELNFVRNYIELEKLRYEDQLLITLNILEKEPGQSMVPLIFVAFIENAFKHLGSNGKGKAYVHVNIEINTKQIKLQVQNSIAESSPKIQNKESGIGIENVRKRLDLLYAGNYNLEIGERGQEFFVELVLKN